MTLNQKIYSLSRPMGGLHLARFVTKKHPKILMYHRISEREDCGRITVSQFEHHLNIIKKHFNPVPLSSLVSQNSKTCVKNNSVAITFDDGYYDFAEYAFPLLKANNIPATIFITTGFVNGDLWLWPDQIKYAIDNAARESISLEVLGGELMVAGNELQAWNILSDYCLTASENEKKSIIRKIFKNLGVDFPNSTPDSYRPLNWTQINNFISEGLEVGSHSVTHPILSKLSNNQLVRELQGSRQSIIENTGVYPKGFCFPNGMPDDFNERVKLAVKAAGYEYAVTAYPGPNPMGDRFAINRYPAQNDIESFEKSIYGLTMLAMKCQIVSDQIITRRGTNE
ncbi:MAG: polysaccharide deacetylase family protein [Marinobacter sp.]|nr:polysaccharide deacetylase family protein [Marinobacter sp.]